MKAEAAATVVRSRVPDARVRHVRLDLGDLGSLKSTVDALELDRLDGVVCNAGVLLEEPARRETAAGNELHFGTNHLGHFALIGRLAPLLATAPAGRVVTTGSFVAKSSTLDPDDIRFIRGYQPKEAYGRSKLAQMLAAFELDRRLRAAGSTTSSVVNHPGGAFDSLTPSRPPVHVVSPAQRLRGLPAGLLLHGKEAAAWPSVRATLDRDVRGGQLWGPRLFGMRGEPRSERVRGVMAATSLAARIWDISVELTGIDPFAVS